MAVPPVHRHTQVLATPNAKPPSSAPTQANAASGPGAVISNAEDLPGSVNEPCARNARFVEMLRLVNLQRS